jgi:hypothetical protein
MSKQGRAEESATAVVGNVESSVEKSARLQRGIEQAKASPEVYTTGIHTWRFV